MADKTKILITGGTGFVGRYLVREILATQPDAELHVTSLHDDETLPKEVIVHVVDLGDSAAVTNLIKDLKPQQLYQLASLASVSASFVKPREVLQNNFDLTVNILEALRLHSPGARTLFISSADIYHKDKDTYKISEATPLAPVNPYAASKAAQDFAAQAYAKSFGLEIIIARPFNHIGAGQALGFVATDFAYQIALAEIDSAKRVIKVGNLTAARDFTAVIDMVKAYTLLMQKGEVGAIYNLGSGTSTTIQSILDSLVALATAPIEVVVDPQKLRPVDIPEIICDNRRIVALGWQPTTDLSQVLTEILADWRVRVKINKN